MNDSTIDNLRFWDVALSDTEIYNIYKGYDLTIVLNEEQVQKAETTLIVLDVDGRPVPNAGVSIYNHTTGELVGVEQFTDTDGSTIFTRLDYDEYNVTVNYSITTDEQVVFNSSTLLGAYNFSVYGLYHRYNLTADLWRLFRASFGNL